jgi:hypothetical protein
MDISLTLLVILGWLALMYWLFLRKRPENENASISVPSAGVTREDVQG